MRITLDAQAAVAFNQNQRIINQAHGHSLVEVLSDATLFRDWGKILDISRFSREKVYQSGLPLMVADRPCVAENKHAFQSRWNAIPPPI